MRKIEQGLVVFAAVVFFSFGFPVEKENGSYKGVVGPEASGAQDEKLLSKRKPPAKIPGPKFINEELQFRASLQSENIQRTTQTELRHEESKENKSTYLTNYEKGKPDPTHMASAKNKEEDKEEKDDKEKGKKKEDKDDKGKEKDK